MASLAKRLASVLIATTVVLGLAAPAASASSHVNDALALLNAERATAGLAPVAMHSDLTDDAAAWSQQMLEAGRLSHNPNLSSVTANWDRLGENVGVGTSISALHDAFMGSAGHRGNILGDYDYVGIAVVEEHSTKLWITVVFMKSLNSTPTEPEVEEPEPYSDVKTTTGNSQPEANPPTRVVASTPVAQPAPAQKIVFVLSDVGPHAD